LRQNVKQKGEVMAKGARENEKMPDGVMVGQFFPKVEDGSQAVENPSRD
jgi:hypothetical protein